MLLALCVFYANACSDHSDVGETKILIEAPVIADITLNSAEVRGINHRWNDETVCCQRGGLGARTKNTYARFCRV